MIIGLRGKYGFKGLTLNDAFARIDVVSSSDENATISLNIYVSEEVFKSGGEYLEQIYPLNFKKEFGDAVGDDRTQGYRYVGKLDQFSSWSEVSAD